MAPFFHFPFNNSLEVGLIEPSLFSLAFILVEIMDPAFGGFRKDRGHHKLDLIGLELLAIGLPELADPVHLLQVQQGVLQQVLIFDHVALHDLVDVGFGLLRLVGVGLGE